MKRTQINMEMIFIDMKSITVYSKNINPHDNNKKRMYISSRVYSLWEAIESDVPLPKNRIVACLGGGVDHGEPMSIESASSLLLADRVTSGVEVT